MKGLLILDLDGTLFNTCPEILTAVTKAVEKQGINVSKSQDELKKYMGSGLQRLAKRIITDDMWTEPDPEMLKQVADDAFKHYEQTYLDRNSIYPTVEETLLKLQDDGWKLTIATNKLLNFAKPILAKFLPKINFEVIVAKETLEKSKPDPMVVDYILDQTKADKERTIFIGDSIVDVQTSRAANLPLVVVVSYGYFQTETIEELGADKIIHQFDELIEICNNF